MLSIFSEVAKSMVWGQTEIIIEIIRLYSALFQYHRDCIQGKRWDAIIIPFSIWSTNVAKYKSKYHSIQVDTYYNTLRMYLNFIVLLNCCRLQH